MNVDIIQDLKENLFILAEHITFARVSLETNLEDTALYELSADLITLQKDFKKISVLIDLFLQDNDFKFLNY